MLSIVPPGDVSGDVEHLGPASGELGEGDDALGLVVDVRRPISGKPP
jgi:hypothetical protein